MVDSHCHLDFPDYQADFSDVLERTRSSLELAVNIGTDISSSERVVALAQQYDFLYATVGVHPHDVAIVTQDTLHRLATLAREPRVVGVGECGLDYAQLDGVHDAAVKAKQIEVFEAQIKIARDAKVALVVHCRDAYDDLLQVCKNMPQPVRGVIHCFVGTLEQAREFLKLGFYLSFTGIITFKNAGEELLSVVRETPLERILVETDAPFLAPVPYRGKRNEPAYVVEVGKKVAELKGLTLAEVDSATTANARALFSVTA